MRIEPDAPPDSSSSAYQIDDDPIGDIDETLNSDDAIWGQVDDVTQDELDDIDPDVDARPVLLPAVAVGTPQLTQTRVAANASASSSALILRTPPSSPNPALLEKPFYPQLTAALREVFGLSVFRQNQLEAISACMENKDVFVLMPTGGGKSLCFQLPAVVKHRARNTVTFVVSPLLSLMTDQVQALREKGVKVVVFNSARGGSDRHEAYRDLMNNEPGQRACLAYITPEFFVQSDTLKNHLADLARRDCIAGFVIDEAHCIQMWGRGFRESVCASFTLPCNTRLNIFALRTVRRSWRPSGTVPQRPHHGTHCDRERAGRPRHHPQAAHPGLRAFYNVV